MDLYPPLMPGLNNLQCHYAGFTAKILKYLSLAASANSAQ